MNQNIIELDADYRSQLINRLQSKHGMTQEMATSALDNALAYMHLVAHNPDCGLGPSEIVDVAWHEAILHTWEYHEYCQRAFGFYLHHRPNREGEVGLPISDTAAFMAEHGIVFDPELWGKTARHECDNNCTQPGPNCDRGKIVDAKCSNPGPGCKNTCAECGRRKTEAQAKADCNGSGGFGCQGGPGCGTQVAQARCKDDCSRCDPRTPCGTNLEYHDAEPRDLVGAMSSDCDGGRGGGPSMCGKGNCS